MHFIYIVNDCDVGVNEHSKAQKDHDKTNKHAVLHTIKMKIKIHFVITLIRLENSNNIKSNCIKSVVFWKYFTCK